MKNKKLSIFKHIQGWAALAFGLCGAVFGLLGFFEAHNTVKVERRFEALQLLNEAWDLMVQEEA